MLRNAYIFDGTHIGANCVVEDSIVGAGARLGDGAIVKGGCLVGDGVVLGAGARLRRFERVSRKRGAIKSEAEAEEEDEDDEDDDDDDDDEEDGDGEGEEDSDLEQIEESVLIPSSSGHNYHPDANFHNNFRSRRR